MADVTAAMRKGMVPWVMANGRIVALMRGGQKLVFGDAGRTLKCGGVA